ncbi:hypothetical protein [Rhodococcus marinonascens]|uniref:hypothetical protein n=1 Tax=Rhodococcus marinonascens TaxID=38311 RepID=UPI0014729959|nr:hypothetical protein [Rhodococcus marinonascens]
MALVSVGRLRQEHVREKYLITVKKVKTVKKRVSGGLSRIAVVLTTTALVLGIGSSVAGASPAQQASSRPPVAQAYEPVSKDGGADPEMVRQVQQELENDGVVPEISERADLIVKDYGQVDGAPRIVTTEPAPSNPGEITTKFRLGAGWGG